MDGPKQSSDSEPAIEKVIDEFIRLFTVQVFSNPEITALLESKSSIDRHNDLIRSHMIQLFSEDPNCDSYELSTRVGKSHISNNVRLSWYVLGYNLFFSAYHEVEKSKISGLPTVGSLRAKWLWDVGVTLDTYYDLLTENYKNESTKLHQAILELDIQAKTDPLTEILNRRGFCEAIDSGTDPGVFVLLDLDNFKSVNDLSGHIAGDAILKQIAKDIRSQLRKGDLVGRIGGDEFCIWIPMPGNRHGASAPRTVRHILKRVPFANWGIAISGGMASRPEDGNMFEELYSKADEALYRAKANGNFSLCRCGSDTITSLN